MKSIKFRMMKDVQIFHLGRWLNVFVYGKRYSGTMHDDGTVTSYSKVLDKDVVIKDTGLMIIERRERYTSEKRIAETVQ